VHKKLHLPSHKIPIFRPSKGDKVKYFLFFRNIYKKYEIITFIYPTKLGLPCKTQ